MHQPGDKLIACRALAHILEPLLPPGLPLTIMDIGLHLHPDGLRQKLNETVAQVEEEGGRVILGYGLCGRALEGVCSAKSTLVLPKVDDCVGMLLGSRQRHRLVLGQHAGCYFLEPTWLDTEMNIFEQMKKQMERIPPNRRESIIRMALKHYDTLALLRGQGGDPVAAQRCLDLAGQNGLRFMELDTDLGLVHRLLEGPWDSEDFVVAPPGSPIPFF